MKKLYFFTVLFIALLTALFLLFSKDENTINKHFLASFGIIVSNDPLQIEEIRIPANFDDYYESYNILQIESGLSLSEYKGKSAVKYTYEIVNFPDKSFSQVFVNVITVNSKPIAGDINCPSLSGFILPLSYLKNN